MEAYVPGLLPGTSMHYPNRTSYVLRGICQAVQIVCIWTRTTRRSFEKKSFNLQRIGRNLRYNIYNSQSVIRLLRANETIFLSSVQNKGIIIITLMTDLG